MSKNLQSHNESIVRLRIIIILGARKRLKCWVVLEASSYFARWREWRCGRRSTTIPQQWSSQVGKQTFCKENFWIELISNNLFWFAQRTKRKKAMHLNVRLMFFYGFVCFWLSFAFYDCVDTIGCKCSKLICQPAAFEHSLRIGRAFIGTSVLNCFSLFL